MLNWLARAACAAAGVALAFGGGQRFGAAVPAAAQPHGKPPAASVGPEAKQQWGDLPTMLLEKMYRGPLRDTVIQRWRDPIDGSVCYVYIPISAPLLPPAPEGYVQYGPNQIGSISCIHPTQVLQLWQGAPPPTVPEPHRPSEPAGHKPR